MTEIGTRGALALLITLAIACDQGEPAPAKLEPREAAATPVAKPEQPVAQPVAAPPADPPTGPPAQPLPAFVLARLDHEGPVTDLAWSADGGVIATASTDGKLRVWDATSYTLTRTIDGPPGPGSPTIAITSDGATLVTHADQEVLIFDARTGSLRHTLAHAGSIFAVAVSASGTTIASGGVDGLRIWSADQIDQTERKHIQQRGAAVVSLQLSANGNTIASGWDDKRVRLIDAATGQLNRTIKTGQPLLNLAYTEYGERVAAPTGAAQFGIFSTATGKLTATIPLAHPLAFGAGGNLMLAAGASDEGEFVISIVDVISSGIVRGFTGHTGELTDAMFSPDSATFATASLDHSVLIWVAP